MLLKSTERLVVRSIYLSIWHIFKLDRHIPLCICPLTKQVQTKNSVLNDSEQGSHLIIQRGRIVPRSTLQSISFIAARWIAMRGVTDFHRPRSSHADVRRWLVWMKSSWKRERTSDWMMAERGSLCSFRSLLARRRMGNNNLSLEKNAHIWVSERLPSRPQIIKGDGKRVLSDLILLVREMISSLYCA